MVTTFQGRTFDWVPNHDPRSRNYPVSLLLEVAKPTAYDTKQDKRIAALEAALAAIVKPVPTPTPTPVPPIPTPVPPVPSGVVLWDCPIRQDQMQTGMCVGYGFSNTLATPPLAEAVVVSKGGDDEKATADLIYDDAQAADGSPSDPTTGASVTGGAKGCVKQGRISAYHWCFSIDDVIAALTLSPVVIGINWTADMMNPDANGVISATGASVGGHCIEVIGWDSKTGLFELQNSWGRGWAKDGRCFICKGDLTALLAQQGEAVILSK